MAGLIDTIRYNVVMLISYSVAKLIDRYKVWPDTDKVQYDHYKIH